MDDGLRGQLRKTKFYVDLMRRRARGGGISFARQAVEIAYLWSRNGVGPFYYCRAGLDRREITWREKLEHLDRRPYLKMVRRINPAEYNFVVMNKIVTHGVLRSFAIPTPFFYGVINGPRGQTFDGKPLCTPGDLVTLIDRVGVDEMCFKLLGGWSGKGFMKVRFEERQDTVVVVGEPDGRRVALDDFWNTGLAGGQGRAYVCQGVIRQVEDVAAFHPWSVNTARVWMYQPERGRWEMFDALLRMGVNQSCVDNTSAGGITARIDRASGKLEAAVDRKPDRTVYSHHPTTGAQIEGTVLPMWEEAQRLCERACRAFPYFRFLALDVAFGWDGPLVIEVECEPGAGHQAVFGHGVKGLLASLAQRGPLGWRG